MVKQGRKYECKLQNALYNVRDQGWLFSENVNKEHFSVQTAYKQHIIIIINLYTVYWGCSEGSLKSELKNKQKLVNYLEEIKRESVGECGFEKCLPGSGNSTFKDLEQR